MYVKSDLTEALRLLGIKPEDTLLVHSSMKSIGSVEGGADTVLNALMEHLQPGLLVLPTLSWSSVNMQCPRFSVNDTPSCSGILTELFRRRPGVLRSWHPTHSVSAYGFDAAAFTAGHEQFDSPCARLSPWGKLVERKSKILFIGTGLSCNTLLHGVEEWADVPDSLTQTRQPLEILTPEGRIIPCPSRRHQGGRSNFYAKLEDFFKKQGILRYGRFGAANCHLLAAEPMAKMTLRLLQADPHLFDDDRLPVFK